MTPVAPLDPLFHPRVTVEDTSDKGYVRPVSTVLRP